MMIVLRDAAGLSVFFRPRGGARSGLDALRSGDRAGTRPEFHPRDLAGGCGSGPVPAVFWRKPFVVIAPVVLALGSVAGPSSIRERFVSMLHPRGQLDSKPASSHHVALQG